MANARDWRTPRKDSKSGCGSLARGGRTLQTLHERKQRFFQFASALFRNFDEAEWLEPSLRRPHGKHDFCFFADRDLADAKDQFNLQFLVERLFYVHQPAAAGKHMQLAANIVLVGKADKREHRSPQLHAKRDRK